MWRRSLSTRRFEALSSASAANSHEGPGPLCCELGRDIVRGYTREDITHETPALDDLARCFAARTRLARWMLFLPTQVFNQYVSDACTRPSFYEQGLKGMLRCAVCFIDDLARPDMFRSWLQLYARDPGWVRCCPSCRKMLQECDKANRLDVWRELPSIMGHDVSFNCTDRIARLTLHLLGMLACMLLWPLHTHAHESRHEPSRCISAQPAQVISHWLELCIVSSVLYVKSRPSSCCLRRLPRPHVASTMEVQSEDIKFSRMRHELSRTL